MPRRNAHLDRNARLSPSVPAAASRPAHARRTASSWARCTRASRPCRRPAARRRVLRRARARRRRADHHRRLLARRPGRSKPMRGALDQPDKLAEHRAVTDAVHAAGGKICLQILHAGRYAKHDAPGRRLGHPLADQPQQAARARPPPKSSRRSTSFAACAALARDAGYDGVEIMGSEGYLISQFTALRTNNRSDRYGGIARQPACASRSRSCARRARASGADFLILFRMSALDLVEGGLNAEETLRSRARSKPRAWTCSTPASAGTRRACRPSPTWCRARPRARCHARIKSAVSIPVIATNRINTPELAEGTAARGRGRPGVARAPAAGRCRLSRSRRPRGAPTKSTPASPATRPAWISCSATRSRAACVNPRACRELDYPNVRALRAKRVAVVGAGAAGLSCALTAFERGHSVTLYEARAEIGGQLNLAKQVPGKEFAETLRYFRRRLAQSSVQLKNRRIASARTSWRRRLRRRGARERRAPAPARHSRHRPSQGAALRRGAVRRESAGRARRHHRRRRHRLRRRRISDATPRRPADRANSSHAWGVDPRGMGDGGLLAPKPEAVAALHRHAAKEDHAAPGKTSGRHHRLGAPHGARARAACRCSRRELRAHRRCRAAHRARRPAAEC